MPFRTAWNGVKLGPRRPGRLGTPPKNKAENSPPYESLLEWSRVQCRDGDVDVDVNVDVDCSFHPLGGAGHCCPQWVLLTH